MATILLIHGASRNGRMLHRALEMAGHRLWIASCPREAGTLLDCVDVDLVIAEEGNGETGLQALRELQDVRGDKMPRFLVMGGATEASVAARALDLGAADVLPLPIDTEEARGIVARALGEESGHAAQAGELAFTAEDGVLRLAMPQRADVDVTAQLSCILNSGFVVPERGVLVDLTPTEYISSSVIGSLYLLAKMCAPIADQLFLVGPAARVEHLLRLAGVVQFYRVVPDEAAALEELGAPAGSDGLG